MVFKSAKKCKQNFLRVLLVLNNAKKCMQILQSLTAIKRRLKAHLIRLHLHHRKGPWHWK